MKKKAFLSLASIATITFIMAITVTANQPTDWDYYAYGDIVDYQDTNSAEIKSGFWNLKVSGEKVWLYMYYLEENIEPDVENSPKFSVDIFEWSILGKPMFYFEDDVEKKLWILVQFQVKKTWATFYGTYEPNTWETWRMLIIDFDDELVLFDRFPSDPFSEPYTGIDTEPTVVPGDPETYDWDIEGTLIEYSYPF
jgi:hypothetical protein